MTKEEHLQVAVADYLRLQYPKILFAHIANERQTTPQRGAKLKRMGVKAGMPDLLIFEQTSEFTCQALTINSGLAIELKIKPNKPSKEQIEVLEAFDNRGWTTEVCYSFEHAKEVIDNYFKNVKKSL